MPTTLTSRSVSAEAEAQTAEEKRPLGQKALYSTAMELPIQRGLGWSHQTDGHVGGHYGPGASPILPSPCQAGSSRQEEGEPEEGEGQGQPRTCEFLVSGL